MQLNEDLLEERFIKVDPNQSPVRLDKFLMDRIEKVSRNKIQNAIRFGTIRVNSKEVKPNFKIRPGQEISIVLPKPLGSDQAVLPENIPIDIRYEDDYLMIIHKPPGLVVHPGIGNYTGTLINALAYYYEQSNQEEAFISERAGLVHRIDKNTSGLMVVAKTDEALTGLAKQFFNHSIERKYEAIVWGNFDEPSGTITGNIGRNPHNRLQMFVHEDETKGKHAVTHYKVLEDLYYVSLVECQLETGRTHQIRVHMRYTGHHVFNDDRYGGDRVRKGTVFSKYKSFVENTFKVIPRHALHAKSLGFIHPITKEKMHFEAPQPDDFRECLERWRHYVKTRKELV